MVQCLAKRKVGNIRHFKSWSFLNDMPDGPKYLREYILCNLHNCNHHQHTVKVEGRINLQINGTPKTFALQSTFFEEL